MFSRLFFCRRYPLHPPHKNHVRTLKEIQVTQTDKETVVEGVKVESDRVGKLLNVDRLGWQLIEASRNASHCTGIPKKECHPLCRLPFVNEIKHTDVLILHQFMQKDGKIMDRQVTGLCHRQHMRMDKLIRMAQKAGLFPKQLDQYRDEKEDEEEGQWSNYNTYWDEKTIDAQWRERQRKSKIHSFRK